MHAQLRQARELLPDGRVTIDGFRPLSHEHEWARPMAIIRRFGSWNAALDAAGIERTREMIQPRLRCRDCGALAYARKRCAPHYVAYMEQHGNRPDARSRYVHVNVLGERMVEQRAVMQAVVGRSLYPEETVHHKGSRTDNRPSRLELRVSAHGPGWSIPDAVAWAHEILARYGSSSKPGE